MQQNPTWPEDSLDIVERVMAMEKEGDEEDDAGDDTAGIPVRNSGPRTPDSHAGAAIPEES